MAIAQGFQRITDFHVRHQRLFPAGAHGGLNERGSYAPNRRGDQEQRWRSIRPDWLLIHKSQQQTLTNARRRTTRLTHDAHALTALSTFRNPAAACAPPYPPPRTLARSPATAWRHHRHSTPRNKRKRPPPTSAAKPKPHNPLPLPFPPPLPYPLRSLSPADGAVGRGLALHRGNGRRTPTTRA